MKQYTTQPFAGQAGNTLGLFVLLIIDKHSSLGTMQMTMLASQLAAMLV